MLPAGHRRARAAAAADIDEAARALEPAARTRIHTFLGDVGSAPRTQAPHHARGLPRADRRRRQPRPELLPTTWSFRRRTRRAAITTSCAASSRRAIDAGATTINLPDTVGYGTPDDIREFFSEIRERVPNSDKAVFSAHCHDDLGLAVANSLAAVQGGVRQIECTINGIGERAGNASLEELVMAFRVRSDRLPFDTAIKPQRLFETSQLLSKLTDEPVAIQQGHRRTERVRARGRASTRTACSRIARTYEIMRPQDVGQQPEQLVLGRHSGRHAVARRCETIGLTLSTTTSSRRCITPSSRWASTASRSATTISNAIVERLRSAVTR